MTHNVLYFNWIILRISMNYRMYMHGVGISRIIKVCKTSINDMNTWSTYYLYTHFTIKRNVLIVWSFEMKLTSEYVEAKVDTFCPTPFCINIKSLLCCIFLCLCWFKLHAMSSRLISLSITSWFLKTQWSLSVVCSWWDDSFLKYSIFPGRGWTYLCSGKNSITYISIIIKTWQVPCNV